MFSRKMPVRSPILRWKIVHVVTRDNAIVNRLSKTKVDKDVDHESERQERLREEGRRKKVEAAERVSRRPYVETWTDGLSRSNKRWNRRKLGKRGKS